MRQVKRVFYLHFVEGRTQAAIATALGLGKTTVGDYLRRLNKTELSTWAQIEPFSDQELERALGFTCGAVFSKTKVMPDWAYIHREMSRAHVTAMLLWTEYRQTHGEAAYEYSQFNEHYKRWRAKLGVVMRQTHKSGEKTFIDYSGGGLRLRDPKTSQTREVELFIAVLGASSYTYAEATLTQTSPDWVSSHARMAAYFGGVSEIWVPDNLKAGVVRADRYEPLINETYRECASHYGACVIPARAAKPRDKAKVEAGVLVVQRWILARLRDRVFTSMAEINEAIWECLEILNNKKMRHLNKSRRELFEELERSALKALPVAPYEYAQWKKAVVNIDYHIAFDHHRYSVAFQLVHERLDVRATASVVEVFHCGQRIASHRRSYRRGGYTTNPEHMPRSHREYAQWTPERVVSWSKTIGPNTALLVEKILSSRKHVQQAFNAAQGLIRLSKPYGKERVERASARALEVGAHSYQFVKEMLKNNMDGAGRDFDERGMPPVTYAETNETQLALLSAENIRGGSYYH